MYLPHLSFLSHWTLLIKLSFLWYNSTPSMHKWFSLVSITNYPLQKFHLALHLLFLPVLISGCSLQQWHGWSCISKSLFLQLKKISLFSRDSQYTEVSREDTGGEQLIQVCKATELPFDSRDYSFPSKKSEPLYFPSSNAARIQINFHFEPKHN